MSNKYLVSYAVKTDDKAAPTKTVNKIIEAPNHHKAISETLSTMCNLTWRNLAGPVLTRQQKPQTHA